jgi:hypothetical protein
MAHDVAARMGFASVAELQESLVEQMALIRDTYTLLLES